MTTIDTKRLRELAEAATPGGRTPDGSLIVADGGATMGQAFGINWRNDQAYLAAIDPPTLIALLDELERLRGDAGWEYYATARKGYVAGEPRVHERGAIQAYEEELDQVVFEQEDETPVVFKRRVGPWEPVEGETDD